MIRQCFLAKTGIQFYEGRLHEIGLDPRRLYPIVLERPPALDVETLNIPDFETGGRKSKKNKQPMRGRTIHDADHTCRNCVEDDMHFHMVAHAEGAHCEYGEEHADMEVDEEHEVSRACYSKTSCSFSVRNYMMLYRQCSISSL